MSTPESPSACVRRWFNVIHLTRLDEFSKSRSLIISLKQYMNGVAAAQARSSDAIVVVDGNFERRRDISRHLPHSREFETTQVSEMMEFVTETPHAVVVLGSLPNGIGTSLDTAAMIQHRCRGAQVVLIADESCEDVAIRAIRSGVREYLKAPVSGEAVAKAALALTQRNTSPEPDPANSLIGQSSAMQSVRRMIRLFAATHCTVLLTGETGTGKELAATAIHQSSQRASMPMICVNCAAIPDTLLESELFGYTKGAFTGAGLRYTGKLEMADRGTLFLDEIGDMSTMAQAKVLRAIETRQIQPLGALRPIPVDIRIIAASHRNLEERMLKQQFRDDLFFRLNIAQIMLPPLRERPEDIPLLVDHLIARFNRMHDSSVEGVTPAAMDLLCTQPWPGNIRQLRNAIEAAFLVRSSSVITERELLRTHLSRQSLSSDVIPRVAPPPVNIGEPEDIRLLNALKASSWNKSKAAEMLRWSRMTVYRKIEKYRLVPDEA
jgi:DNA-binding NtrC family response regulator